MGKGNFTEDFRLDAIKQITERGTRSLMFQSAWASARIRFTVG
jgi:hypothetical protein